MKHAFATWVYSAGVFVCIVTGAQAATYRMVDLEALTGTGESWAYDVNDAGQAVGAFYTGGYSHPCIWQNGSVSYINTMPYAYDGVAYGINNNGLVVGNSGFAWLWQNNAISVVQDTYHARQLAGPCSTNDDGQVAGQFYTGSSVPYTEPPGVPVTHACVWQNGSVLDLGTLNPDQYYARSEALSNNDNGQVVGWSDAVNGGFHACLWQDGSITDLGFLPGGNGSSQANAINDLGQVVGMSYADRGGSHAFTWYDGTMTDLGAGYSAQDINDDGDIVGTNPQGHACLWQNGSPTDLGVLPGSDVSVAYSINAKGEIVGYSYNYNQGNHHRATLWEPVPEPTSALAVLCGIGGLIAVVRTNKWPAAQPNARSKRDNHKAQA